MANSRRYKGQRPRIPLDDEFRLWIDTAHKRDGRPPKKWTADALRSMLAQKNFVRWYRMRRDFRWAQRQLLKVGVDPEEVRWIL